MDDVEGKDWNGAAIESLLDMLEERDDGKVTWPLKQQPLSSKTRAGIYVGTM